MLLRNRTAIAMAIARVDIFSQNEIARSWRGGSATMRIMPVIARSASEPQNHGQNRSTVAPSVSSRPAHPMTRRPTISTDANRIAIATMWVVCIAGTTQDDFASAMLGAVSTSQFANDCKNSLRAYHVGRSLRRARKASAALSCRHLVLDHGAAFAGDLLSASARDL